MRISVTAATLFLSSLSVITTTTTTAFAPALLLSSDRRITKKRGGHHRVYSNNPNNNKGASAAAVESEQQQQQLEEEEISNNPISVQFGNAIPLTGAEINARLATQLEKLAQKDCTSTQLTKQDLKVVYEDAHIAVINKPSGVLTVPGKNKNNASLNKVVYDNIGCDMGRMDMMVVHRLGMDTSGLIVFTKTMDALRGMNTIFRTRNIERKYEALVCGHVKDDEGIINLPIMRDYEFPPYVRISTLDHQRALLDLDPEEVGKKLLEAPKESITKYEVISREELKDDDNDNGLPVTRLLLTSMSGRTHQLNVHLAAFGHPIVGDDTYGLGGYAASYGGLTRAEQDQLIPNPNRASIKLQKQINDFVRSRENNGRSCAHAKSLKFYHPVLSNKVIDLSEDAPF